MNYLSVCSGIEAATAAWHPLGWHARAFSEIEPFPSAVLAHHYPTVPNLGDMTKFNEWNIDGSIDLLVGGTPCQSFSVAGLRKGLADPRGNLMLTYLAIADKFRPRWLVWENVPGVLSSNRGMDFGALLGGLGQLGYGFAYRILDAQYFGVPQRRRRVFLVGHLGDWHPAAAVLFERHSLQGHPAPRRQVGQRPAGTITRGSFNGSPCGGDGREGTLIAAPHADICPAIKARDSKGVSSDGDGDGAILVPMMPVHREVAPSLTSNYGKQPDSSDTSAGPMLIAVHGTQDPCTSTDTAFALGRNNGGENTIAFSCKDHGADAGDIAPTLRSMGHDGSHANAGGQVAVAFMENVRAEVRTSEQTDALTRGGGKPGQGYAAALQGMQVRRLTPRECERLQGFPDDYTLITMRGKPSADGPRYKALGNSMAVPVMAWIGSRIAQVDHITKCERVLSGISLEMEG